MSSKRKHPRDEYAISARFSEYDPGQMEAFQIIHDLRSGGRSLQSIITEAVLLSQGQQYPAPTLGDMAVFKLAELIERLEASIDRLADVMEHGQFAVTQVIDTDGFQLPGEGDDDYAAAMLDYLRRDDE